MIIFAIIMGILTHNVLIDYCHIQDATANMTGWAVGFFILVAEDFVKAILRNFSLRKKLKKLQKDKLFMDMHLNQENKKQSELDFFKK